MAEQVLNEIDAENYKTIITECITCGGNLVVISKADISHLFTWKYLLSLKLRRNLELIIREQLDNTTDFKDLGTLIGQLGTRPNDILIKDFYEKNKELLNAFNHSSARFIPPILVYRSKDIQETYNDLITLKDNMILENLQAD